MPQTSTKVPWILFLAVLAIAMAFAARSVSMRASRMKPAQTTPAELDSMQAGTQIKVVVRLSNVDGQELSAIRLQPQTDAVFCAPTDPSTSIISAILAGDTSIVMGKPHEIRPGAIIQLAGAFDNQHRLHVKQVVILSGYVRISESPCPQ